MGCACKESQYQHTAYKKNETPRSVHQELLTKNLSETLHCTPEFTLRKSRSCCCSWQRALSCAICDFSCSTCLQVDGRQLQNSDKRKSRIITQIDRGDIFTFQTEMVSYFVKVELISKQVLKSLQQISSSLRYLSACQSEGSVSDIVKFPSATKTKAGDAAATSHENAQKKDHSATNSIFAHNRKLRTG